MMTCRKRQKREKRLFGDTLLHPPGARPRTPAKGVALSLPPELNSGRYLWSLLYYVSRSMLRKGLGLMQSIPAWKYLIGIFAVFWVVLAIMLFISDIPFYVITWSLTIILILSAAIVALAWAYQNNW
jgi:hypothetical protein